MKRSRLPKDIDRLLGTQSVCDLLDCSRATLLRYVQRGMVPTPDVRLGNIKKWRLTTIQTAIDNMTVKA